MKSLQSYLSLIPILLSFASYTAAAEPAAGGASSTLGSELGVIYAPFYSKETILLRQDGSEWHSWKDGREPALSVRLQQDGSMLRLGGMPSAPAFKHTRMAGGYLQRFAWDGSLLWEFPAMTSTMMAYGDALVLPNGNVLTTVLEFKTREECEQAGRDPSLVTEYGMFIPALVEYRPNRANAAFQVWKWSLWDHMYQARHPALPQYQSRGRKQGRVDLGLLPHFKGPRWLLPKEIDYLPEQDLILMVVNGSRELWVIDHGTTTLEAATDTGGRRNRGGSVLAWSPAAGNETQMVSSAEWRAQSSAQSATAAELLVLTNTPKGDVVDELRLDLNSLEFAGIRRLEQQKIEMEGLGSFPASFISQGGSGQMHVLGNTDFGKFGMVGEPPAKGWTHRNEKGVINMVPYTRALGEACCGGGTGDKPSTVSTTQTSTTAPPVRMQRAPITRPRVLSPVRTQQGAQ